MSQIVPEPAPVLPSPGSEPRCRVRFEAEFGVRHSFGHASRELSRALLQRGRVELRLLSTGAIEFDLARDAKTRSLLPTLEKDATEEVDFHIRQFWPPNFDPPASGRWILIQPWEYGSLPRTWVNAFRDSVDEVWCPSRYVQDIYRGAGFDSERTPVVPYGIDPDVFQPDAQPLALPTRRTFKFLYVGGTIYRKGADILLDAYRKAFSSKDDVVLVVKDMGTRTFYRAATLRESFAEAARDGAGPQVIYTESFFSESDLASLYAACDVLVAPYRGEGFSLPVLEAMACGLHVIVTRGGATDDFVDVSCGTLVPSDRIEYGTTMADATECVGQIALLNPKVDDLAEAMRRAYENREDGRQLGRAAALRARKEWTWERAAAVAEGRIERLAPLPPRRGR
jgi:glycosyltransferase involved in cell wall biosynthesis